MKYVLHGCDREVLRSDDTLLSVIGRICVSLGMRMLHEPQAFRVDEHADKLSDPNEDEGGITAFVVVSTSHISVHGWPLRRLAIVDVFSCRDFYPGVPAAILREVLKPESIAVHDVSYTMACRQGVGSVKL